MVFEFIKTLNNFGLLRVALVFSVLVKFLNNIIDSPGKVTFNIMNTIFMLLAITHYVNSQVCLNALHLFFYLTEVNDVMLLPCLTMFLQQMLHQSERFSLFLIRFPGSLFGGQCLLHFSRGNLCVHPLTKAKLLRRTFQAHF